MPDASPRPAAGDDWKAMFDVAAELAGRIEAGGGGDADDRALAARLLIGTIDAVVLLTRPDGRVVETTKATMGSTGLERGEVVGAQIAQLPVWRSPADATIVERLVRTAADGRSASAKVEFCPEHGIVPRALWLVVRPVKAADGDVVFLVAHERVVLLPLTEQSSAEEPVVRQLHRVMEGRRQLVADLSHDLREPLLSIATRAERLLTNADETVRREGARMRAAALGALVQMEEMSDLAGLEHRRTQLRVSDVELVDTVRTVVRVFEPIAGERDLSLTVESPSSLVWTADAGKVTSIISNLLSNAIRYAPVGGRVRVTVRTEPEFAVLEVADSGPGIAATERDAVFRRAWRGASARYRTSGSGLGLAIVQEAVRLHQGSIRVGRAPEGGALMVVRLPHADLSADTEGPSIREAASLRLATEATVADLQQALGDPSDSAAG